MIKQIIHPSHARNIGKVLRTLLLLALLMPLGATSPAHVSSAAPRLQPVLSSIASHQPDSLVSVIVQKSARDKSAEQLVGRLGGTITKDLHIINAFAATVPAKVMPQLAGSAGVRWVSLDAPVVKVSSGGSDNGSPNLLSVYPRAVQADRVWNTAPYIEGQGVGVAVLDSGMTSTHADFSGASGTSRVVAQQSFNSTSTNTGDQLGHGTHVAGIIGGNGTASNGGYVGIAPKANLINVKVSDDHGGANSSDVVEGLQWIVENKTAYNIRVVNMSLNSSVNQSYNVDPIDAAVEILWFNRIVVVVSAGNNGPGALLPPANDPFVITVGAMDDHGTINTSDDTLAPFSAYGTTTDGFTKPDLVAPGVNIISDLAGPGATFAQQHPDHLVSGFTGASNHFRMSGTSMAAPMVAGAAALILQNEPTLNPDQVKFRLISTGGSIPNGSNRPGRYLNVRQAVNSNSTDSSNTGTAASRLLWTGNQPINWGSVNWGSVNWGSVNWGSVNWGSVNWGSVNWGSDFWGP